MGGVLTMVDERRVCNSHADAERGAGIEGETTAGIINEGPGIGRFIVLVGGRQRADHRVDRIIIIDAEGIGGNV